MKNDLPYKDKDFVPVAIVGLQPGIYVSGVNSGINNINDLLYKLSKSNKPFIGGYAAVWNLNVDMLKKRGKLQDNIQIVGYKGAPDILLNILNDTIPVGVVATTASLYQLAKEGKINIIGSTADEDFVHDGVKVASVSKALGVPQTKGGILLSLKPNADKQFVENFVQTLKKALNTDRVKDAMYKTNIASSGVIGVEETRSAIYKMRKDVLDIIR
jgi:tripartite-type tricarboxylate transporter receptor subunit TctC